MTSFLKHILNLLDGDVFLPALIPGKSHTAKGALAQGLNWQNIIRMLMNSQVPLVDVAVKDKVLTPRLVLNAPISVS